MSTKTLVLHPWLFALAPIVFLYANNVEIFDARVTLLPMLVALVAVTLVWAVLSFILRNRLRSGIMTSLSCLLLYSHGHVLNLLRDTGVNVSDTILGMLLLLFGSGIVLWTGVQMLRTRRDLRALNGILNFSSLALILLPVLIMANYTFRSAGRDRALVESIQGTRITGRALETAQLPDVYFIVFDGYARGDVLEERYGVSNADLRRHLEQRGFFVADQSHSNYSQTALSLASTLNMDYIEALLRGVQVRHNDFGPLRKLIQENRVVAHLKALGYNIVSFASASDAAKLANVDVFLDGSYFDEFSAGLLSTTPVPLILRWTGEKGRELNPYAAHRDQVLFKFAKIVDLASITPPRFVFAHFLSPHPPFVFGANGEHIDPSIPFNIQERAAWRGYIQGYANQVRFLSARIKEMVDQILAQSETPPVIVIQSDHGPGSHWLDYWRETGRWDTLEPEVLAERMSILNAVYLPAGSSRLYEQITSVNTFRVVFNQCFGAEYPLLPDRSLFSFYQQPYVTMDVTERLRMAPAGP